MENKTEAKNSIQPLHLILGVFCTVYCIGMTLRLFMPELHNDITNISTLHLYAFYRLGVPILFAIAYKIMSSYPDLRTALYSLIGCCEAVSCTAILFHNPESSLYIYSICAIVGGITGYISTACFQPKGSYRHIFSYRSITDWAVGLLYGFIAAWIVTPLIISNAAENSVGNNVPILFGVIWLSTAPFLMLFSEIYEKAAAKIRSSFAAERDQVMKEQDLYDENCARIRAEKEAREKAAKEAQERARKDRERQENARREHERQERERRERERKERAKKESEDRERRQSNRSQQSYNNNRSSSSSGSSHRSYTGSWNNAASSYFKDCTSKAELKRRYHKLCKKLHPDSPTGNAESFRRMKSEYDDMCRRMAG